MREVFLITFFMTAPASGGNSNEHDAYHSTALASYKASGLESDVDRFVQKELKNVPKNIQTIASNIFLVGKTIQERKITYEWSF